jgi:hypothetical protein
MIRAAAIALAAVGAVACGGGGEGDDGPIDVSGLTYEPCPAEERAGGFAVILAEAFTAVQGQVKDGPAPGQAPEELATDGACRIVQAPAPFCDPACPPGETCAPGNTCVLTPVAQDVGTVAVAGMLAAVEMLARPPLYFYSATGTLPHPGVAAGAGVRLTGGGAAGDFALLGWGVDPLAVGAPAIEVTSGAPVAVSWTPPSAEGPVRVALELNINAHGVVGQRVTCDVEDTGAFAIPAPLVTMLFAAGVSGFPTLEVRRSSADATDTALGCVDFRVESARTIDVTIPGLESCNDDGDCTPPETCRPDLTCG